MVIILIYWALGYWATGKTIYKNVFLVYDRKSFVLKRMIWGMLGGWLLIPWALIAMLLGR